MKEPLIVDFLEQFLHEHHLAQYSNIPSRPESVNSYRSSRSLTNHNRISHFGFPTHSSSSRLSVRVSQAELLEYGIHSLQSLSSGHQSSGSSPSSPTSSTIPLKSTTHSNASNGSPVLTPRSHHHLSRPTSMTSLDVALSTMDLNYTHTPHHNNTNIHHQTSSSSATDDSMVTTPTTPIKESPAINKPAVSPILPNSIKNDDSCTTTA